ncbi:MAG: hypothetical protein H0X24_24855, partial [Ktedonobacterales bacterium]|nr:hypothetical protein [Ktedonobacterales bacterium]
QTHPRTPPEVLDALRVQTLRGDKLGDLTDRQREWVWRSLLKDVRRDETMALGHLTDDQYARGVVRVRRWYEQRLAAFKALPKAVRPVKPLVKPKRRGFWLFGKGGN